MAHDLPRCIHLDLTVAEAADLLREGWHERDPAPDVVAELYCLIGDAMGERMTFYVLASWAGWGDTKARKFVCARNARIRREKRRRAR